MPILGYWDDKEVLLIEFPAKKYEWAIEMVEWLISLGYKPMIAHPEKIKKLSVIQKE
ncbi:hypothetical protein THIOSC15_150034 [uncultured Thiomicrorhabdus sp.]